MNNSYVIEGDIVRISLPGPHGRRFEAIVDTNDLDLVMGAPLWRAKLSGPTIYAFSRRLNITMHRCILRTPARVVNHKNGDRLDNRRSNLRIIIDHGEARPGTPEYASWACMKARCRASEKSVNYASYSGRGIKVCERWLNSYPAFLEDMGRKPTPSHSLDRIDVNGDYTPSNTRWANNLDQQNNRRDNRFLEHDGRTLTISQWAREVGLSNEIIADRIDRGLSVEQALTTPIPAHYLARRGKHYIPCGDYAL